MRSPLLHDKVLPERHCQSSTSLWPRPPTSLYGPGLVCICASLCQALSGPSPFCENLLSACRALGGLSIPVSGRVLSTFFGLGLVRPLRSRGPQKVRYYSSFFCLLRSQEGSFRSFVPGPSNPVGGPTGHIQNLKQG